jgi:hypothetical protein
MVLRNEVPDVSARVIGQGENKVGQAEHSKETNFECLCERFLAKFGMSYRNKIVDHHANANTLAF